MKVYIAGPYTGGDPVLNVRAAIKAGDRVAQEGHTPFVPHLYHFWHLLFPHDYEFWMRLDFDWLPACEALIRLPGDSSGADREVSMAKELGLPVYDGIDVFLQHVGEQS